MIKNIINLLFFLSFIVNLPFLRAQEILNESDINARHRLYKSEWEHRQSQFLQSTSSLTQQSYDALYYKLEFQVGIEPNSFSGRATERFVSLTDSLRVIELDFDSYLTIVAVSGDAESYTLIDYTLTLNLNSTFNTGDTAEVIIEYEGIPREEGFYAAFWFGIHRDASSAETTSPVVYTLSEPFGARSWWPCKDDPTDKVDSTDVFITIPVNSYNNHQLYAVSNGKLIALIENDDGTRTFHWHENYPIATYLVSLAISNYEIYTEWYVTTDNDSMPVIYYVYPERMDDALNYYSSTVDMIKTYSERFVQYPFFNEKYGMANFGWSGAMEHQTVTSMGSMRFWVVAHELAHQWFGDLVTCADFHHIWLNEGWATYLEAIYAEKLYGSDGYHQYMNGISYYTVGKTIYVEDPLTDPIFDIIVYDKGAWVLHMLRHIMGDDLFFPAIKSYLTNPMFQYNSATTADFRRVMEEYYGSSLEWFFQPWIFGMGYPSYEYNWTYKQVEDNYIIDLQIKQVQDVSGSEYSFQMPLDVVVTNFPELEKDTLQVWNYKRIHPYRLVTKIKPAMVELDPANWVLKKSKDVSGISDEHPAVISKYYLEQNYPNPFNLSTVIGYNLSQNSEVELIIYNMLGEKVTTLVAENQTAGNHTINWDASEFPSGVYYYRINANEFQAVKKMILVK